MKLAFGFAPVTEADFDELLALRIATMRESQRHGFMKISEDEWGIAYERPRHLAAG